MGDPSVALTAQDIQAQLDADAGFQQALHTIPVTDRMRGSKLQDYLDAHRPDLVAALNAIPHTNGHSTGFGIGAAGKVGEGGNTPWWEIAATGAAALGGAYGLNALLPAASEAGTATGVTTGLTTGATYAAPVSTSAALSGAAVSGASGATAGAGMAIPGLADILLKYGVPIVGNLLGTKMQVDASGDAAKLQNDYNLKALAAAQEEQQYNRGVASEALAYNRGQYGNYLTALQPYRQAGTTALERLQSALSDSAYQPNNGYRQRVG